MTAASAWDGRAGAPVLTTAPIIPARRVKSFTRGSTSGSITPQAHYAIYAVQNCDGSEGVNGTNATVPALNNLDGTDAIQQDMMAQCPAQ